MYDVNTKPTTTHAVFFLDAGLLSANIIASAPSRLITPRINRPGSVNKPHATMNRNDKNMNTRPATVDR